MNIYYTAKDIEELAGKGVRQLELGPNVFLTDFAYETAEQLAITLIRTGESVPQNQPSQSSASLSISQFSGQYNKPRGCQHGPISLPAVEHSQPGAPTRQSPASDRSVSVNKLVDIMGKIIKRGD